MKIPKKIKVGGHEIKVLCPYEFRERCDINGSYDKAMGEIRICKVDGGGNPRIDSEIAVTLLHEILHACDYVSGHRMFEGQDGENKIEGLSEVLYQVLRDNKLKFYDA